MSAEPRPMYEFPHRDEQSVARRWRGLPTMCMTALLIGCGSAEDYSWTEDVQVADGAVVQVRREVHYSSVSREMGGPGGEVLATSVLQILPEESAPLWKMSLKAIHLDRNPSTGRWIVIATFLGIGTSDLCGAWLQYGFPPTAEVALSPSGGEWMQVEMPEEFFGRRTNLLSTPPGDGIHAVSQEGKRAMLAERSKAWSTLRSDAQMEIGRSISSKCKTGGAVPDGK